MTLGSFGIILDKEKRVLLCHRKDYDLWNLPGGKVESLESPWDAVIREVREETGLNVEPQFLAEINYKPERDDLVFTFVCKVTSGEIKLNEEADRIDYFELSQIPKNTSPKQLGRIQRYYSDPSKTHFESQYGKSSIDLIKEGKL